MSQFLLRDILLEIVCMLDTDVTTLSEFLVFFSPDNFIWFIILFCFIVIFAVIAMLIIDKIRDKRYLFTQIYTKIDLLKIFSTQLLDLTEEISESQKLRWF